MKVTPDPGNDEMTPLFLAAEEATEEAIYNSFFMEEDMTGQKGRMEGALPLEKTLEILERHEVHKSY